MWFLRSHSESYQAAAFLLLTFDRIWTYYSSVHHYWYGVWLVFLIVGLILQKAQQILRAILRSDNVNRHGNDQQNLLLGNANENRPENTEDRGRNEGAANDNENRASNENDDTGTRKDNLNKQDSNDNVNMEDDKDNTKEKGV